MALRAGYYGVKRRIWEALQATTEKNVQDIATLRSLEDLTGAVNLFMLTKDTDTINGVTYTVNSDKTVTVNNTATANSLFIANDNMVLPAGVKYRITKGITDTNPQVNVNALNGSSFVKNLANLTTQEYAEFTPDYDGYDRMQVIIYVPNATAINNKKISIMITPEPYIPDSYVAGAMTNQQLSDALIKRSASFDQVTATKSGYMVELSFTGTTITNEDGKTLGTLDAAYRPSTNINLYSKVYNGSSYVDAQVKVTASSGAVELLTLSGNAVTGAQVNFLLARPVFMSGSAAGVSRSAAPDERSLEVEEPVVVKKSTRKTTKKTEEEE